MGIYTDMILRSCHVETGKVHDIITTDPTRSVRRTYGANDAAGIKKSDFALTVCITVFSVWLILFYAFSLNNRK
jgi:hypothetical protein